MHETYNVSVSKHLRGEKKGGWMCPPTSKLNFTLPLIRNDYTSPPQSPQAALRVTEPILTAVNYLNIFFYLSNSQKNLLK